MSRLWPDTIGASRFASRPAVGSLGLDASRLGIELGEVTSVSLDTTGLTAGTAKVVLF